MVGNSGRPSLGDHRAGRAGNHSRGEGIVSKAHLTGKWLMTATVCSFLFLLLLLLALAPGSLRAQTTPPPAPEITSLTPRDGALIVAWFRCTHPNLPDLVAYDLRYIRSDADATIDANWTVLASIWTPGSGWCRYTLGGLTNDVDYDVQVRAVNSVGAGPWSATATGGRQVPDGPRRSQIHRRGPPRRSNLGSLGEPP